jgi:serine/threonine-protein kinase
MPSSADRISASLADRYRIERELGQGGMATVYLAEDLKHKRKVALKVLKPELAAVLGAERFVQEITTTAALQHPHILPLFDSGTADGFLFYVMPFIDGETLRNKLDRETQLGVDEAVKITTEVADALDYAHRNGVIHRDIKPENILLHDGRPMVADFGIALAVSAAAGGRMTETGLSLGTPHYMSPEQATAEKEITARSDVYSLASVLYEMLTGNPPHTGASAQQIIMKIVTEEAAPVTTLRKSVPPNVAAALAKALEKLPADRFTSAREFADVMLGITPAPVLTGAVAQSRVGRSTSVARHPMVLGLTVGLVGAVAVAVSQWNAAHREITPDVVRFAIEVPSSVLVGNVAVGTSVAVSPDGKTIAYVSAGESGASQLFTRPIHQDLPTPLAGTDGAQQPCFSPDGLWIAYLVQDAIWKVEAKGGTPVMVGQTGTSPTGMTWSSSGLILLGTLAGLRGIPAAGGGALQVLAATDSAAGDLFFNQPRVLSDGEMVLFSIQSARNTHLGAYSLRTKELRRFDLDVLDPLGYLDGSLVYTASNGAIMALDLDLENGRARGDPVALGITAQVRVVGASDIALSPTGTLVYQAAEADLVLGWAAPDTPFVPVLQTPGLYSYPRLSPDGRRIALAVITGGRSDIWVYDLVSSTLQRLTSTGFLNDRPEWTPDGSRVVYRSDEGGSSAIMSVPVDLSGPPDPLQSSPVHDFYEGVVSPDGRALVYQIDDSQADVMYRFLEGDTASRPLAASLSIEAQARVSPNGRWVALVTDASGTAQVVVQPFPGPGGQVQVSNAGGSEPVWARDGRRIFYRDGRQVIAADVTTDGGFAVTGRTGLFPDDFMFSLAPHANYDVSPDGRRFLMTRSVRVPKLVVVYGWLAEFRARMASVREQ